jgi:hypothetical protein
MQKAQAPRQESAADFRTDTMDARDFLRDEVSKTVRLGHGLPDFLVVNWENRQIRWDYSRRELERLIPNIFTTEYFMGLPRLGGGREAEVRELVFPTNKHFLSYSNILWRQIAIKKFNKDARSDPFKQARSMHSLELLSQFWFAAGALPSVDGEPKVPLIKVPQVITYKYPFCVMKSLHVNRPDGDPLYLKVTQAEREIRHRVYKNILRFGHLLYKEHKLIERFKSAGIEYPNLDLNPANIFVQMGPTKNMTGIWVLDQSSVEGGPTYEIERRKGSRDIMFDRAAWGLN